MKVSKQTAIVVLLSEKEAKTIIKKLSTVTQKLKTSERNTIKELRLKLREQIDEEF